MIFPKSTFLKASIPLQSNNMDKQTLLQYQKTAETVALEAGKILLNFRGKAQILRSKKDFGDIVTEADEASEKYIIFRLNKAFPTHTFLSEESGQAAEKSEYRWVIDPLDGTKEFAKGVPLFAVNIALEYKHELVLGITHFPVMNELYSSAMGLGANFNGIPIHVSYVDTLEKSIVYAHPPKSSEPKDNFDRQWETLKMIALRAYRLKTGSSEQFYCPWVALGAYEAYWLSVKYPSWWDMASLILIVQEAGGKVTTGRGNKVTEQNFKTEGILATNGKIHDQLLALIQKGIK